MSMKKTTILFDLDGTLTDPGVGITRSAQYALGKFGFAVPDPKTLYPFIGPPLRQSFKEYCGFDDDKVEEVVAAYREYYLVTGIYENELYPGIDDLLKRLKSQDKTLIVATSKAAPMAHTVLKYFHLDGYFSFVGGAEMNGDRSEKSEVLSYIIEQCKLDDPTRCVMVGDRKYDIIGAKAVGIDSIGVLYGYGDRPELEKAGAGRIATDVKELEQLLCD